MAGSRAWFAALFAAAFLGSVLDEATSIYFDFSSVASSNGWAGAGGISQLGLHALQFVRSVAVIGFGMLFDIKGPRISLLVGPAAFVGMGLGQISFGSHSFVPQILRTLVHPSCGLVALGARGCSHEERPALVGRLLAVKAAGAVVFHVSSWWIYGKGYGMIFVWICLPLMALQLYLTRPCSPGGPRQDADLSPLPAPTVVKSRSLPLQVLLRPELLSVCIGVQVMMAFKIWKLWALGLAAGDHEEKHLPLHVFQRVLVLSAAIIILTWSHLPSMAMRRYGPQCLLQGLLEILTLVDFFAMLLFYVTPQATLVPALLACLEFTIVVSVVIQTAAITVAYVFALGVVEAGEHGTSTSLLQVGDEGRHYPFPLFPIAHWLYATGGISTTLAFFSVASLALLVLFRRSPLLHFHLKEG